MVTEEPIKLRDPLFVMGDNHGNLRVLSHAITDEKLPESSDIVLLGDNGIMREDGGAKWKSEYAAINRKAAKRDIRVYMFRGNHDCPEFYKHENSMSNVIILEDLDWVEYKGKIGLIIPGAVSIDKPLRKERSYPWFANEEMPNMSDAELIHYSFIFSHTCTTPPEVISGHNGILDTFAAMDPTIIDELEWERLTFEHYLDGIKPARCYCGHFHVSSVFNYKDTVCVACNVDEIKQVTI